MPAEHISTKAGAIPKLELQYKPTSKFLSNSAHEQQGPSKLGMEGELTVQSLEPQCPQAPPASRAPQLSRVDMSPEALRDASLGAIKFLLSTVLAGMKATPERVRANGSQLRFR